MLVDGHVAVAVEGVVHYVAGIAEAEAFEGAVEYCAAEVSLALPVAAVHYSVLVEVVPVVGAGEVPFGGSLERPLVAEEAAVLQLAEGCAFAQLLLALVGVVAHHAWQIAVVVVVVSLGPEHMEEIEGVGRVYLCVPLVHLRVDTVLVYALRDIVDGEGVVVLCVDKVSHGAKRQLAPVSLAVNHRVGVAPGAEDH